MISAITTVVARANIPTNQTSLFKLQHTLDIRCEHYKKITEKYPDRIPIIMEKSELCKNLENLKNPQLLANKNAPICDIIRYIRNNLKVTPTQSIYVMIGNYGPGLGETIEEIHAKYKDRDGFLYIVYLTQNTFG